MRLHIISSVVHQEADDLLREAKIDGIERYNEILVVVDLLKGLYDTWLAPDAPSKVFVGDSVLKAHALLINLRQLVFVYCGEVVAVKPEIAIESVSSCGASRIQSSTTHNPSNQLYIWSAYLSARSRGIAPLITTYPSRAKSSRQSP